MLGYAPHWALNHTCRTDPQVLEIPGTRVQSSPRTVFSKTELWAGALCSSPLSETDALRQGLSQSRRGREILHRVPRPCLGD